MLPLGVTCISDAARRYKYLMNHLYCVIFPVWTPIKPSQRSDPLTSWYRKIFEATKL